jgi:hypothetical protein
MLNSIIFRDIFILTGEGNMDKYLEFIYENLCEYLDISLEETIV